MAASIVRLGGEQRVNTYTTSDQRNSSVTALPDGGWVVTWQSYAQDGDGYGVYQQRYNADGSRNGGEQMVNYTTTNSQFIPSVAALSMVNEGGWLVTWMSNGQDGDGNGIYQQRYNADGSPVTDGIFSGEQQVNTTTANDQGRPSVTGLPDGGGWLVTWESVGQDGDGYGIYQQRYHLDGWPNGSERRINTTTAGDQFNASVTTLNDGGWVVTWQSLAQDGSSFGVYQQRYDKYSAPIGSEQQVNTITTGMQYNPSVTALADGGWIVTWMSAGQDGSGNGIYQQRYNADGLPHGGEERVNTTTTGDQLFQSVTALSNGGWIVTWVSGDDIYQQLYDADGSPRGGENRVNVTTQGSQAYPTVTALKDGTWVVTWTSDGQDGSGNGIFQQHYAAVAEFGDGREFGTGSADNEVFHVRNGGLSAGDSLAAGLGTDTLRMSETGTLDLTAPDLLTGIELVQGSSGNDVIIADTARIADIVGFQGGGGSDELRLKPGSYDLTSKFVAGIEAITLQGTGSVTVADKATALLLHSQTQDGTLLLVDDSFTLAERTQLYHQGIRSVTDAGGTHSLQPAVASLSAAQVQENAAAGTVIGTLSASDPNPGDGLSVALIDSAGGRFALKDGRLVVANGKLLDYESAAAHQIVVRVTDTGGISVDQTLTVTISDIVVEIVRGTSGSNALKGGAGQDRLYGGLGNDTLTGGGGQDVFVFDTRPGATNLDRITDFNVTDDALWLDNAIFTALGSGSVAKPALLRSSFFHAGAAAHDSSDRLIYNKMTGALYYDADGTGAAKQVQIATLAKNLALSYKDFFVI